jgi:putative phosphoesterase
MPTLGVISDTHGLLRAEAIALLQGVDHIIHAGDIGNPDIIKRLETVAPVSAIRGNIDVDSWAAIYPETLRTRLFGLSIFVIHDRKDLAFSPGKTDIDLVISGHSHRASIEMGDGVLYLNPGSTGPRRFRLPITLATVRIANGQMIPEIHEIA